MKKALSVLIILFTALSFAACEKANNPVTPKPVAKIDQNNSGTFEVTYKDYKNYSHDVILSGDISINFGTTTYSYDATVNSDNEQGQLLHDSGTYRLTDNDIEMMDNAAKMMNPNQQPSLYLSGTYSYKKTDSQIIIEGEGEYGTVKLVLNIK